MGPSIAEKILSSNKFYTERYLKDTINLVKSILLTNKAEASLYNEYVQANYIGTPVDVTNKSTWRYYMHLSGEYHQVDKPMTATSLDNGDTITLSKDVLKSHRLTHKELLSYGLYYQELIAIYPEQELLVRAIIASPAIDSSVKMYELPDYTIVAYNKNLVEDNEEEIMLLLQDRITNYKNTKLIQYYAASDSLFLASLFHILYNYIVTSLIAIRLSNAKTIKAHSYHVLNYLSSHHYLDEHYPALTRKQALFLYRNLLYLNNHSGIESTFKTLIGKLFTDRDITAVTYRYNQRSSLRDDGYTRYTFNQVLLNNAPFVHSKKSFELEEILEKEKPLAPKNERELIYSKGQVDSFYKSNLNSSLLTKDIETIVVDNTDNVKYKLIETIMDYWVALLKKGMINFLVTVTDPISNRELKMTVSDLYKLFIITLYKSNGMVIDKFPVYRTTHTFRENLPTVKQLRKFFYNNKLEHKNEVAEIVASVPPYTHVVTSYQFEQYVTGVYELNVGLWLHTSNISERDDEGQIEGVIRNLHESLTYATNNETVAKFLSRYGLEDIFTYPDDAMSDFNYTILNNLYDGKLSTVNRYKYIQRSLVEVFKKFNSYTVQHVENYALVDPALVGPKDLRYTMAGGQSWWYFYNNIMSIVATNLIVYSKQVEFKTGLAITSKSRGYTNVPLDIEVSSNVGYTTDTSVTFGNSSVNSVVSQILPLEESSEDDLLFLALTIQDIKV